MFNINGEAIETREHRFNVPGETNEQRFNTP